MDGCFTQYFTMFASLPFPSECLVGLRSHYNQNYSTKYWSKPNQHNNLILSFTGFCSWDVNEMIMADCVLSVV